MELISTPLAVTLVVVGALALGTATVLALRGPPTAATGGAGIRLAPLVPWLGSALVVVLLVRGSIAGAVFVGVATLVHAGLARARAWRHPPAR